MRGLYAASNLRRAATDDRGFVLPDGSGMTTSDAMVANALARLADAWPGTIPFDDLARPAIGTAATPGTAVATGPTIPSAPTPPAESATSTGPMVPTAPSSPTAPAADAETRIGGTLLALLLRGAAEFHSVPPPFTTHVGGRPASNPLARLQALRGGRVTTLRHETIDLDEPHRRLVALLDGSATAGALARRLGWMDRDVEIRLSTLAAGAMLLA